MDQTALSGADLAFLEDLNGITTPADPAPVVADFVRTADTPAAILSTEPATLDDLDEALADFELTPAEKRQATIDAWLMEHADLKRENEREGWTAQVFKDWNAWRAGKGKANYNANRKKKRHAQAEAEGRTTRTYEKATPERRQEQNNAAQAKRRQNMTPEQREEEKRRNTEAKARKRAAKKAAKAAVLKDSAIF